MNAVPRPPVAIETFVSKAFQPGENPDHKLLHGNVLQVSRGENLELPYIRAFLGETATRGGVESSIYDDMLRERKLVADQNLLDIFAEVGVEAKDVLKVGFTADGIGFYDELKAADKVAVHTAGWQTVTGYNTMFARASQVRALCGFAADCSIVKGWATLPDGDTLMMLTHLTRDNIEGDGALSYGENHDQSFLRASLEAGAKRYSIEIADFHLEQMAKIDVLDYYFKPGTVQTKDGQKREVDAEGMMDFRFRGWFDQGLLHNISNPGWQRGDPIPLTDHWVADYQAMTEHVIWNSGVPTENIEVAHAINPGDVNSGHASNAATKVRWREASRMRPAARDAYMVIARKHITDSNDKGANYARTT